MSRQLPQKNDKKMKSLSGQPTVFMEALGERDEKVES
jgi:hypothetical protein